MTHPLLTDLASRGVLVSVRDGRLHLTGAVTNAVRAEVARAEPELLAALGMTALPPAPPAPSVQPPATCPGCKQALKEGRCWHCNYRPCEKCGRDTCSPFCSLCLQCDIWEVTQ